MWWGAPPSELNALAVIPLLLSNKISGSPGLGEKNSNTLSATASVDVVPWHANMKPLTLYSDPERGKESAESQMEVEREDRLIPVWSCSKWRGKQIKGKSFGPRTRPFENFGSCRS
jgi:hypothetical protein